MKETDQPTEEAGELKQKRKRVYVKPKRPNACRRRLLRVRGEWPTAQMKARKARAQAHDREQSSRTAEMGKRERGEVE